MTPGQRKRTEMIGDVSTALCGGALALSLLLVVSLLGLLAYHGLIYFWQRPLAQIELADSSLLLGEIYEQEAIPVLDGSGEVSKASRTRIKTGNRDVTGNDFIWVDDSEIVRRSHPEDAILLERLEWGDFYGHLVRIERDGAVIAEGPEASWNALCDSLRLELLRLQEAEAEAVQQA